MAEGMLIGAGLGLGTSLLTKQDPLKGALLGAATAGIGSGIKEGLQGAGILGDSLPAMTADAEAAKNLGSYAAQYGELSPTAGAIQVANAVPSPGILGGVGDSISNLGSSISKSWGELKPEQKWLYGGIGALGAASMLQGLNAPGMPEDKSKPFFKYNPKKFRPSFYAAEGGVVPDTNEYATGGGIANLYTSGHGPLDQAADGIQQVPNQQDLSSVPAAGYLGQSVKMMASGGISDLGGYSDGGRLLKGPGDGMSDNIPASISGKQPARLADGEFVVPADVVSHLGNGSTDAGAKQLYAMMDRVRHARTGNKKQGKQVNPRKVMKV